MIKINITEISSAKCWYSQAVSLRCLFNDHKVFINDNVSWPLMVYIHPSPLPPVVLYDNVCDLDAFLWRLNMGFQTVLYELTSLYSCYGVVSLKGYESVVPTFTPPFIKNELIQRLTKRGWVRDFVFWLIWIKSIYFALSEKNGTYYKPVSCLCRLYHKYYAFQ